MPRDALWTYLAHHVTMSVNLYLQIYPYMYKLLTGPTVQKVKPNFSTGHV